jgi:virulence factor
MLRNSLMNRFRSMRNKAYLDKAGSYRHRYAFIGAGTHSIANLYPCIRHQQIPLKYICTNHAENAQKMASGFPGCTGTDNIADILNDPSVRGVFLCTGPALHFELAKKLLLGGKAVFVEKPPALSLTDLDELIRIREERRSVCMAGLQKRFSTINGFLKKARLGAATYNYRYLTGAYPEGNPLYELFIHPLDNAVQLFGKAKATHIEKAGSGPAATWFVNLEHATGALGILELSTAYSWRTASETLAINTQKEIWQANYPFRLTGTEKPATIAGIPSDKLLDRPVRQKIYVDNNGFIPSAGNNSLVSQGFFGEIEFFVSQVERNSSDDHGFGSLRNVYELIARIDRAG